MKSKKMEEEKGQRKEAGKREDHIRRMNKEKNKNCKSSGIKFFRRITVLPTAGVL